MLAIFEFLHFEFSSLTSLRIPLRSLRLRGNVLTHYHR